MHRTGLLAAVAAVALVAGCGQSDDASKSKSANAGGTEIAQNDNGTTAAGADSHISCPPPADNVSGPDIVGLKLGMSRDQAMAIVQCHAQTPKLENQNTWMQLNTHGIQMNPQYFTASWGVPHVCRQGDVQCMLRGKDWDRLDEQIMVAAPGVPGHETVAGVWRTQNFEEGKRPAVSDLISALEKKYGQPQFTRSTGPQPTSTPTWPELIWVHGPDGTAMSPQNPNFDRCAFAVRANGNNSQSWSPDCGLTIHAYLTRDKTNSDLVEILQIGMMDQKKTFDYGDAIQKQLDQMDAARRQEELQKAKQSGASDVQL